MDRAELLLFTIVALITSAHSVTYQCDKTASCGCSAQSTVVTSRIVGGEDAADYTWGWSISLQRYGSHSCGASLLTPQYAVTAAHCVYNADISSFSIVAGTNNIGDLTSSTVQRRSIIRIIIHPNYNYASEKNDIAILQFSPLVVSSSSKLAYICLPKQNVDPFQTNSNLVAIGWGVTSETAAQISYTLQQVTVQAMATDSTDCQQSGLSDSTVQFCAGVSVGGKDTCQGDSGGPLMAFSNGSWILVGLTSFGYGCARKGYPGVYTRVSALVSFVQSYLNLSTTTTTTVTTTKPVTTMITTSTRPTTPSTATKTTTRTTIRSTTQSTTRPTTRTTTRPTTRTTTRPTTRTTTRPTTRTTTRPTTRTTTKLTTRTTTRSTTRSTTRPTTRSTTRSTTTKRRII